MSRFQFETSANYANDDLEPTVDHADELDFSEEDWDIQDGDYEADEIQSNYELGVDPYDSDLFDLDIDY